MAKGMENMISRTIMEEEGKENRQKHMGGGHPAKCRFKTARASGRTEATVMERSVVR